MVSKRMISTSILKIECGLYGTHTIDKKNLTVFLMGLQSGFFAVAMSRTNATKARSNTLKSSAFYSSQIIRGLRSFWVKFTKVYLMKLMRILGKLDFVIK